MENLDVEWDTSIGMGKAREMAVVMEMEMVASTGMETESKEPGMMMMSEYSPKGHIPASFVTEAELIEKLIEKDPKAIHHFVNTYQKQIIKTAYYLLSNMEDAEDLSQEVFLEILKSISQFRKSASLTTWIYRITLNKSLDELRRQNRKRLFQNLGSFLNIRQNEQNGDIKEIASLDTRNEDNEKRIILEQAVSSLPENQKIAFILNKYEEQSYKEIADIMNLSLSSVESLIHRAKLNLQKKLLNYFSEYGKHK